MCAHSPGPAAAAGVHFQHFQHCHHWRKGAACPHKLSAIRCKCSSSILTVADLSTRASSPLPCVLSTTVQKRLRRQGSAQSRPHAAVSTHTALHGNPRPSWNECWQAMERADIDGDGTIDFEEFVALISQADCPSRDGKPPHRVQHANVCTH